MKITTVADVHAGNHPTKGGKYTAGINERCRSIVDVLKAASDIAREAGAILAIAGDTFEIARPSPQIIRAVIDAIGSTPTVIIPGNHDRVTDLPGDHALAPMGALPNVQIFDVPTCLEGVLFIPPAPRGESSVGWLDDALTTMHGVHTVIAHFGLPEGHEHPAMRGPATLSVKEAFRLCKKHGAVRLLSGDWHSHKTWTEAGIHVEQIGALVPTGWDNPGSGYGNVAVWDTDTGEVVRHVLPGPRFYAVSNPKKALKLAGYKDVFVRLTTDRATAAAFPPHPQVDVSVQAPDKIARAEDVKVLTANNRAGALSQAADELVPEEFRVEALAMATAALTAWRK